MRGRGGGYRLLRVRRLRRVLGHGGGRRLLGGLGWRCLGWRGVLLGLVEEDRDGRREIWSCHRLLQLICGVY